MATEQGVLSGTRVIDLTRTTAGLFATMIMGDMGAEVIKQEPREITPRTLGRFVTSERKVGNEDLRTIQTYRNKKASFWISRARRAKRSSTTWCASPMW